MLLRSSPHPSLTASVWRRLRSWRVSAAVGLLKLRDTMQGRPACRSNHPSFRELLRCAWLVSGGVQPGMPLATSLFTFTRKNAQPFFSSPLDVALAASTLSLVYIHTHPAQTPAAIIIARLSITR